MGWLRGMGWGLMGNGEWEWGVGRGGLTREAGHVDAVGAADEGDYAMGGGGSGEEGKEEDLVGMHFD